MNISVLVNNLRCSLLRLESRLLQAAGLEPALAPALVGTGTGLQRQVQPQEEGESPGLMDGVVWMAVPKKRRTIEVNRTRRRAVEKLLKVKTNIEPCPECGHLKQKHILCAFCYAKVSRETGLIRRQIQAMEGGPLRAPATETVVLYDGETPSQQDKERRVVERPVKRPAWFSS